MSQKDYAASHRLLGLCRTCPKPLAKGSSIFCDYHRVKDKEYSKVSGKKAAQLLKAECFQFYGGKCHCCGETKIEFLTLDHEQGNGNIHRIGLFKHNVGGTHMYRWLKKNLYPKGYTILCMNCNWATRYGKACPHTHN